MGITGLPRDMSTAYLEMMNWDLEAAVEMWQKNN